MLARKGLEGQAFRQELNEKSCGLIAVRQAAQARNGIERPASTRRAAARQCPQTAPPRVTQQRCTVTERGKHRPPVRPNPFDPPPSPCAGGAVAGGSVRVGARSPCCTHRSGDEPAADRCTMSLMLPLPLHVTVGELTRRMQCWPLL